MSVEKPAFDGGEVREVVGNIQECRMQLSMLECDLGAGSNLVKRATGPLMRINAPV